MASIDPWGNLSWIQAHVLGPKPHEMENPEEHEQAIQDAESSLDRELRSRARK